MKRQKPIAWVVLFLMAWGIGPATAHEFWVAPQSYSVQPGDSIAATLRVGRMFRGTELPYLSSGFHSFTVTDKDGTRDVEGIEGDIPAVAYEAETPGLQVITYHSIASELAYDDWEKFLFYLSYEGLEEIAEQHRARGLPEVGFKEDYSRVAKALVQVGPVADTDRDKASGAPLSLF